MALLLGTISELNRNHKDEPRGVIGTHGENKKIFFRKRDIHMMINKYAKRTGNYCSGKKERIYFLFSRIFKEGNSRFKRVAKIASLCG